MVQVSYPGVYIQEKASGVRTITGVATSIAGFVDAFPRGPLGPPRWDTHEGRRQAYAGWRLNWDVGTRYEYHPTSAHWVLADVIRAVTGEDHRRRPRGRGASGEVGAGVAYCPGEGEGLQQRVPRHLVADELAHDHGPPLVLLGEGRVDAA